MPTNYQQNLKFTPKPEKILEEFSFNGGLITDAHETKLQPNQSPDLANVVFNNTNSIKTRNGYLRYNTDPIEASSNQANTGASTGTTSITTTETFVAQTFTVASQTDLLQINLYLAMQTVGQEQYVQVELWSGATGPNAVLTSEQILLISGTSETVYKFRLREHYTLAASTEYAIAIKPFVRGSTQTVNQVNVHKTGAAYGNGAAYSSANGGVTWSAIASSDLKFVVLTGTATGCTGLMRYYNTSAVRQLIGKFGTGLYLGDDNTGAMTAITLGSGVSLDSTAFIDWTIVNDTLLVADGTNKIQKYRGSTNANYSTGTISVTASSAVVTGSSTVWNTATNAAVGEYIKLPDSKWYKISAITSDTSLTIETEYLGATLAAQTYKISAWGEVQGKLSSSSTSANLVVPTPNFIASHLDRVWTLSSNTLRFSALDTSIDEEMFNDWDTANNAGQINIPANKGDSGTGLYSINGHLYIFQRNAIWVILGNSPANFELRNISNEIGLIDRRTVVEYDAYIIFYSGKDVYIFDGTNLKNLSLNHVNTLISSWGNTTSPVATLWKSHYILSYTPSGANHNSEAIFYDISNDIFGKFEGVMAGAWSVWNGSGDTNQVYFGSSDNGSIYKWDTGGHDDGYEIETRYNTPSIGLAANMNDKVIKKVYIQQLALGDWEVEVNQYTDITNDVTSTSINIGTSDPSLWDVAQWDVDSWADESSLITSRVTEFQGTGKYFRYELIQTGYSEGIEVLGITLTARTRRLQ